MFGSLQPLPSSLLISPDISFREEMPFSVFLVMILRPFFDEVSVIRCCG